MSTEKERGETGIMPSSVVAAIHKDIYEFEVRRAVLATFSANGVLFDRAWKSVRGPRSAPSAAENADETFDVYIASRFFDVLEFDPVEGMLALRLSEAARPHMQDEMQHLPSPAEWKAHFPTEMTDVARIGGDTLDGVVCYRIRIKEVLREIDFPGVGGPRERLPLMEINSFAGRTSWLELHKNHFSLLLLDTAN